MRIRNIIVAAVSPALAAAFFLSTTTARADQGVVALQYHFSGTAKLTGDTNFDKARRIFSVTPAQRYQDLVLNRLAGVYGNALQFDPAINPAQEMRPLLDDLLRSESMGSFGGNDKNQISFVLAARLDDPRAQAWQKTFEKALHGPGQPLTVGGFSGWVWNRPGKGAIWMLRARDWVVVGRGDDLPDVRADYLQQIQQNDLPHPVVKDSWLGAEIDWSLLKTWVPLTKCPFKLARTIVDVTASNGRFHGTAYVSYPDAVPWQSQQWRIPKGLVSGPLTSFVAGQDLEPYLAPDPKLSSLPGYPLKNQFIGWAMREMVLLSYAAWPVDDASNVLQKLGAEAPAALNPALEALNHSHLLWASSNSMLAWAGLKLTEPMLKAEHGTNGDFLEVRLFPLESHAQHTEPSEQLWSQFDGRDDLVYYGWELTGLRVRQWRLLSELLPLYPPATRQQLDLEQKAAKAGKNPKPDVTVLSPIATTEAWLAELTTPYLDNTVTEVTRTSPTELTIVRNSSSLFTGFELVLLSHWLADAPMGPIDYSLLPQAKVTMPGMPPAHH